MRKEVSSLTLTSWWTLARSLKVQFWRTRLGEGTLGLLQSSLIKNSLLCINLVNNINFCLRVELSERGVPRPSEADIKSIDNGMVFKYILDCKSCTGSLKTSD